MRAKKKRKKEERNGNNTKKQKKTSQQKAKKAIEKDKENKPEPPKQRQRIDGRPTLKIVALTRITHTISGLGFKNLFLKSGFLEIFIIKLKKIFFDICAKSTRVLSSIFSRILLLSVKIPKLCELN